MRFHDNVCSREMILSSSRRKISDALNPNDRFAACSSCRESSINRSSARAPAFAHRRPPLMYRRLQITAVAIISEIAVIPLSRCISQYAHATRSRVRACARARENPLFPSRSRPLLTAVRFLKRRAAARDDGSETRHTWFTEISDVSRFTWPSRLHVYARVPATPKGTEHAPVPCELNGLKDSGAHTRCSSFRE